MSFTVVLLSVQYRVLYQAQHWYSTTAYALLKLPTGRTSGKFEFSRLENLSFHVDIFHTLYYKQKCSSGRPFTPLR
jgi:hypothetical protein